MKMIGNMGLLKFFTLCKEKIEENEFLYNTNKFDIMTIQSADLNTEYFGVFRTKYNMYEMHQNKENNKLAIIIYKKDKETILDN